MRITYNVSFSLEVFMILLKFRLSTAASMLKIMHHIKETKVRKGYSHNYKFKTAFSTKSTWSAYNTSPHHLISRYLDSTARFHILMVTSIKMTTLWDVGPCSMLYHTFIIQNIILKTLNFTLVTLYKSLIFKFYLLYDRRR